MIIRKKKTADSSENLDLTTKLNGTASEKNIVMMVTALMPYLGSEAFVQTTIRNRTEVYYFTGTCVAGNRIILSRLSPVHTHRVHKKEKEGEQIIHIYTE